MKNFCLLLIASLFSLNVVFSSPVSGKTVSDGIQLTTNLYILTNTGTPVLIDGTLTMYGTDYSNDLDRYDARKMTNPGENWGMVRDNKVYIVERRHVIEGTDSVFFKMWHMRNMDYRVEFIATNLNFPGRTAILIDNYLKTSTPVILDGNTEVNFSVNADPASSATDRFRMIISNTVSSGFVPFQFVFSNAVRNNQSVNVTWQAKNLSVDNIFDIQKSTDGIHFQNASTVIVNDPSISQYGFTDQNPKDGENYYRISSSDKNGKTDYSKIMKVSVSNDLANISVYPNPATAENLNLKMADMTPGEYTVKLMNSFGQSFMEKKIQYKGGTTVEKIQPAQKIPSGIYRIEIISHDGNRKTISIVF